MFERWRFLRNWWVLGLSVATALGVAGAAFASGGLPGSSAGGEGSGGAPTFTVSGVRPGATVRIFALHPQDKQDGYGTPVVASVRTTAGGRFALAVDHAQPGAYVAVEFVHGDILVSNVADSGADHFTATGSGGFGEPHVISPATTASAPPDAAAIPAVSDPVGVSLAAGPGTLNGPTCGSLSIQQVGTSPGGHPDLEATWSQCDQLTPGQFVVLIGAGPINGGNPFDNPPPSDVWGFWYGSVNSDQTVTIDMGDHNTLLGPGDPNYYFPPGEWFDMSVFSSSVESPAGQLPEVPFAAMLPLLAGAPLLWAAVRRRATS